MIWLGLGILVCVALAMLGAVAGDRVRPQWSALRIALLAALPLPAIVLAPCVYAFVDAARASPRECGVDACGMVMMVTSAIATFALLAYASSALAAWIVVRDRRRR